MKTTTFCLWAHVCVCVCGFVRACVCACASSIVLSGVQAISVQDGGPEVAAGPGTDVGNTTLLLITQTASGPSNTWAYKPVGNFSVQWCRGVLSVCTGTGRMWVQSLVESYQTLFPWHPCLVLRIWGWTWSVRRPVTPGSSLLGVTPSHVTITGTSTLTPMKNIYLSHWRDESSNCYWERLTAAWHCVDTNTLIKQPSLTIRLQEVRELANVPSCWEALRCSIVNHCELLIGRYQETLSELERLSGIVLPRREQCCVLWRTENSSNCASFSITLPPATSSFKSSLSKSDKHLQFVPTNLHCQRMEVSDPQSPGSLPLVHRLLLPRCTRLGLPFTRDLDSVQVFGMMSSHLALQLTTTRLLNMEGSGDSGANTRTARTGMWSFSC